MAYRPFLVSLALMAAVLTGCAAPNNRVHSSYTMVPPDYTIDSHIRSENQDDRVRYLILHYTATNYASSLAILTQSKYRVSAHYLVPDQPETGLHVFKVNQLVDESQRAWHAGLSAWQGENMLNASSIGIETVNLGFLDADSHLPANQRHWYPFPKEQMKVVGELAADIVKRHGILPYRVLGHSDIAPERKYDPGPLFPWERLYKEFGVGAWPDADTVELFKRNAPYTGDVKDLQKKLAYYGYDLPQTGILDAATTKVIIAFQMHFQPNNFSGVPDTETVAILDALIQKYLSKSKQDT